MKKDTSYAIAQKKRKMFVVLFKINLIPGCAVEKFGVGGCLCGHFRWLRLYLRSINIIYYKSSVQLAIAYM